VAEHHHMTDEELARERGLQHEAAATTWVDASTAARGTFGVVGVLAWLAAGVPFLIGVYIALSKAAGLFH
jgi:hypothetical protein